MKDSDTRRSKRSGLTGAALRAFIDRTWPTYRQLTRAAGMPSS